LSLCGSAEKARRQLQNFRHRAERRFMKDNRPRQYIYPLRPAMRIVTDPFFVVPRQSSQVEHHLHSPANPNREAGSTAVQEVAFTARRCIAYVQAASTPGSASMNSRLNLFLLQTAHQTIFLKKSTQIPRRRPSMGRDHGGTLRCQGSALLMLRFQRQNRRFSSRPATAKTICRRSHSSPRRSCSAGANPSTPIPWTKQLALHTQTRITPSAPRQILAQEETGVTKPSIPSPVPYAIESLTNEIEIYCATLPSKIYNDGRNGAWP